MQTDAHPNDKFVTIMRKESFINNAQKATAAEFISMSKKTIGSFFENSHSKTIGSGLNFDEQKLLLPTLVDCQPDDRMFRDKVAKYYASIATRVPYDKGLRLNIGLTEDNSKPLSETNQPIHLANYITYRHAIRHPLVALGEKTEDNNMLKEYFIFDAEATEDAKLLSNTASDEALELYLKVKKTPDKIDALLTLLNIDPRTFTGRNAAALKLEKLKSLVDTDPAIFVAAFNERFFEELYQLKSLLNVGLLVEVGGKIIDKETGDTLGHNMQEAIAWWKDKANHERLIILKARMQEALKPGKSATAKVAGH